MFRVDRVGDSGSHDRDTRYAGPAASTLTWTARLVEESMRLALAYKRAATEVSAEALCAVRSQADGFARVRLPDRSALDAAAALHAVDALFARGTPPYPEDDQRRTEVELFGREWAPADRVGAAGRGPRRQLVAA